MIPSQVNINQIDDNCAIRLVYRYCGTNRTWNESRQYVRFRGIQTAVKTAQRDYQALEKAIRDDNFNFNQGAIE